MTPRALIAPTGRLRVAINTGNGALVQQHADRLAGVSPALAERLAQELDLPAEFQIFPGAGAVVQAVDGWDIAFLAVEPARTGTIAFTAPYVRIEGSYAVRDGGPIASRSDVDQPGRSVMLATGAAYDHALTRMLRHATILRADTPALSIDRFLHGEGDAVAAVLQTLQAQLAGQSGVRILPDPFLTIGQAMAVPRPNVDALPWLDDFLRRAKSDGFVRKALDRSGQQSLKVAP